MKRDPFGNPSHLVSCNRGRSSGEFRVGLVLGLEWHDGPTLVCQAQFAGWWLYLRWRLWYSERLWRRSGDRWHAECLAGEHEGITVEVRP